MDFLVFLRYNTFKTVAITTKNSILQGFLNRAISTLALFFFFLNTLEAQEPYYRKISFMEGLPTQVIYDLYVSKSGLIYLGTERGLVSFDGVRFLTYDFDDNLGFAVNSIQEDESGMIWCKNFANQIFKLEQNKLIQPDFVRKVLEDEANNLIDFRLMGQEIYLLTEFTFFRLSPNKNPKIIFQEKNRRPENLFSALNQHPGKSHFEITSLMKHYVVENDRLVKEIRVEEGQKETVLFQNELFYLVRGNKNELYQLESEQPFAESFSKSPLFYRLDVALSKLWLCTSSGIYPVDVAQRKILPGFFTKSRINKISEDHEGNLWLTSLDEGLFFIPHTELQRINLPQSIGNPKITSLFKDSKGNLFAGTSNGKAIRWNQDNQTKIYDTQTEIIIEYLFADDTHLITSQGIFDLDTGKKIIHGYFGKHMVKDDLGNYLVANFNSAGLLSTDLQSSPVLPNGFKKTSLIEFNNIPQAMYMFRNKRARSVYFDATSTSYYVGFSDGLYGYLPEGKTIEIKTPDSRSIVASDIKSSPDGGFWVASTQQGLLKVFRNTVVAQFIQTHGLIGSYCKRLQINSKGIWVLTDTGVNFLKNGSTQFEHVSYHLGFKGLTFNDFLVDEERIWLATNEGLISGPIEVFLNRIEPTFTIGQVKVNGVPRVSLSQLNYQENQLDIFFQTHFYKGLGDFVYEYRLLEQSEQWKSQTSQINKVSFLSLRPGNYTFQARVKYGNDYTPIQEMKFVINPPFWSRLWFLTLLFLLLSIGIYLLTRFFIQRVKKKQEMREKLVLSQLTALRSQMNPHFMFNVLNAVQGLIYDNQKTKASEYLGTFSDLMRKTLDSSDQSEITIAKELETIELYVGLEEARFEENTFFWSIEVPSDEDLSQYVIPSLILQPFIENAIKHGLMHKAGEKMLHLKISRHEDYWFFEITDNGVGRKQSALINSKIQRHRSFATQALENRIALLNEVNNNRIKIEVQDLEYQGQATGTRVVLQIPVKSIL